MARAAIRVADWAGDLLVVEVAVVTMAVATGAIWVASSGESAVMEALMAAMEEGGKAELLPGNSERL